MSDIIVNIREDQLAGSYANSVAVFKTETEYTLDFLVKQPTQVNTDEDAINLELVSRVHVPYATMKQVVKDLEALGVLDD